MGNGEWHPLRDSPIGTINFDGGRSPEIYDGNGEWQSL
jgi:hypothetical protein